MRYRGGGTGLRQQTRDKMTEGHVTRWAVLGTGPVAGKFILGLKALGEAAVVTQVASRSPENAAKFGAKFKVPVAASFDAAIAAPDVDAVYIATPPAVHEAQALAAIGAGKAVLIEKPVALNADAARRIATAAGAAGVFCMEAMWTRFMPMITAAQARIDAGEIGELRGLTGSFGISNAPDPAASLFDAAAGGGALMHRGFYPVSLARMFLGPIIDVQATARMGAHMGETGVDEDCALTLRHEGGALSTITASLRAPGTNDLTISGTHGRLTLNAPVFRPSRAQLVRVKPRAGMPGLGRFGALREGAMMQGMAQRFGGARGGGKTLKHPYAGNGYHYQAAELARCVAAGEITSPVMPMVQSIEVMAVLDAARAAFEQG